MTPADIIKLAREHGLAIDITTPVSEGLDIVFKLGRIVENKECEKVCNDLERKKWESIKNLHKNGGRIAFAGPFHCAQAIAARRPS